MTKDQGASFQPDSSGFGPGGPGAVLAMKVCFTDQPGETRWYLDTLRRIWRRGENVFTVAPGINGLAWAGKSDGTLWELVQV